VLEQHMIEIGFLPPKHAQPHPQPQVVSLTAEPGQPALAAPRLRQCPKCGQAALIRLENCDQCTSCDYSKCG